MNSVKEQIINICKRMYDKQYVVATSGNVSIRVDKNFFIITPSGFRKEELTISDLVLCDNSGRVIEGKHKPSSEILSHVKIYSKRSDINAIIHAHATYCVACSINDFSLENSILPEVTLMAGSIPTSKYVTPGTNELATEIEHLIENRECVILKRHGLITTGQSLIEAFNRLETVEHAAKIIYLVKQYGEVPPLHREDLKRLIISAQKRGLKILNSLLSHLEIPRQKT